MTEQKSGTSEPPALNSYLNWKQYGQLLQPVNPRRVHNRDGMSHMEAYDIRAHLNRIFGFGRWSADVVALDLVNERFGQNKNGKDACYVVYRAGLRLTVNAPDGSRLASYTEFAAGDALGFPIVKLGDAHDFAIKTAESQALKRAAMNLGDQFGLSLYNRGSMDPLVGRSLLQVARPEAADSQLSVDADAPSVNPEAAPDADPDDNQERPSQDAVAQHAFQERFAQVKDNVNGLLALGKWAHNAGAPEEIINQVKTQLDALGYQP